MIFNKIHETENKEKHSRKHWKKKTSKIQPTDSLMTRTEFHVSLNKPRLSSHPTAEITRLDNTFPPITQAELENIVKRLKHKAPCSSGITATQLQHLQENMMQQLAHIYNIYLFPMVTFYALSNAQQ